MKCLQLSCVALLAMAAVTVSAEELYFMDPGFEGLENMDIVPEVLTATRLKQARAEVPGSMTVITADDIAHWGVRTIPELMRFVPGMFVKHGSDDAVAYHASNPSLMRRMQVLIDGRSV
ncbi:MAG: Plug domain-containing protein, partial [Thalassolituus sp.]